MPPPVLYGVVKLELHEGFEDKGEVYSVSEGLHYIYESPGCSSLRVASATQLADTQMEVVIAALDCKHAIDTSTSEPVPSISLILQPVGDQATLNIAVLTSTRNGIRIGSAQSETIKIGTTFLLQDHQKIVLQLEGRGPNYPTLLTNFGDISVHEISTIIPSSDLRQEIQDQPGEPGEPSQITKNTSFVKETPTTSRYVDKISRSGTSTSMQSFSNQHSSENHDGQVKILASHRIINDSPSNGDQRLSQQDEHAESVTETNTGNTPALLSSTVKTKRSIRKYRAISSTRAGTSVKVSIIKNHENDKDNAQLENPTKIQKDLMNLTEPTKMKRRAVQEPEIARAVKTRTKALQRDIRRRKTSANDDRTSFDPPNVIRDQSDVQEHGSQMPSTPHEESISSSATSPRRSQRHDTKQLKVTFSSSTIIQQSQATRFLQARVKIVDEVDDSIDLLCIGSEKLVTTVKVLKAVLLGKPIISDTWVQESISARKILPYDNYYMRDERASKQWTTANGWSSGKLNYEDGNAEFAQLTLYITPDLYKAYGASNFAAIRDLGNLLGFKSITSYPAASFKEKSGRFVALGCDSEDKDVRLLQSRSIQVYHKDLLTASILTGRLQTVDKFILDAATSPRGKGRKAK